MRKGLRSCGRQSSPPRLLALGALRGFLPAAVTRLPHGRGNSAGLPSGSATHAEPAASHHQVEQDHQDERGGVGAAPRLRQVYRGPRRQGARPYAHMHGVGCRCTHAWCLWEYHACYSELVAVHTPCPHRVPTRSTTRATPSWSTCATPTSRLTSRLPRTARSSTTRAARATARGTTTARCSRAARGRSWAKVNVARIICARAPAG
jgi:hypothetical protein